MGEDNYNKKYGYKCLYVNHITSTYSVAGFTNGQEAYKSQWYAVVLHLLTAVTKEK